MGGNASILAGVFLVVCGASGLSFRAFLVGAFENDLGFSPVLASDIVAASAGGLLLGNFIMLLKVHVWNRRKVAWAALSLMFIANLSGLFLHLYQQLLVIQFLSGLGEGILMGLGAAIIAGASNATRYIGLQMVLGSVAAAATAYFAPYLIQWKGVNGIFLFLLVYPFIALLSTFWVSRFPSVTISDVKGVEPRIDKFSAGVSVLGTLILFSGLGMFWPFMESIVIAAGVPKPDFGKILSVAIVLGGVVAFAVSLFGDKYGYLKPALLGCAILISVVCTLTFEVNGLLFFILVPAYLMSSMLLIIYHNSYLASLDAQGRVLVFGVSMESLGGLLGPLMSGGILRLGGDYKMICWSLIVLSSFYVLLRFVTLRGGDNSYGDIHACSLD